MKTVSPKIIILIVILSLLSSLDVNGQTCEWAEKIGGSDTEYASKIAIDSTGNLYVLGCFESPVLKFNNGISLKKSGFSNFFIAKYNSSGTCQWAEMIGDSDYGNVSDIAVDDAGNIFVTGFFNSHKIIFNNNIFLENISENDNGFITKYNSSGTCQWTKKIAESGNGFPTRIVLDVAGNIYIAGYFYSDTLKYSDKITLNISPNFYTKTPNYNSDMSNQNAYIAKYNKAGICLWAEKLVYGWSFSSLLNIAVDNLGNVYVADSFYSSASFNNAISLKQNKNNDYCDAFIAKYNSSGTCQWAEKIEGNGNDNIHCIKVDKADNICIGGSFNSLVLSFNNGISLINNEGTKNHNSFNDDAFIAKYNSSGTCLWAEKIEGSRFAEVSFITVDKANNIYIAGFFETELLIVFDHGICLTCAMQMYDFRDGYLAKYDSSGVCQWAEKINGKSEAYVQSITIDRSDNLYIFGNFDSYKATFNNGKFLDNYKNKFLDVFLAKYNQNPISNLVNPMTISLDSISKKIEIKLSTPIFKDSEIRIYSTYGKYIDNINELYGNYINYNSSKLPAGEYIIVLLRNHEKIASQLLVIK